MPGSGKVSFRSVNVVLRVTLGDSTMVRRTRDELGAALEGTGAFHRVDFVRTEYERSAETVYEHRGPTYDLTYSTLPRDPATRSADGEGVTSLDAVLASVVGAHQRLFLPLVDESPLARYTPSDLTTAATEEEYAALPSYTTRDYEARAFRDAREARERAELGVDLRAWEATRLGHETSVRLHRKGVSPAAATELNDAVKAYLDRPGTRVPDEEFLGFVRRGWPAMIDAYRRVREARPGVDAADAVEALFVAGSDVEAAVRGVPE